MLVKLSVERDIVVQILLQTCSKMLKQSQSTRLIVAPCSMFGIIEILLMISIGFVLGSSFSEGVILEKL